MPRHSFVFYLVFVMLLVSIGRGEVRDLPQDISFELNQGQVDPSVKFIARTGGYRLFLTGNAAVLAGLNGQPADTLTMRLLRRIKLRESRASISGPVSAIIFKDPIRTSG
jgi:hypothetical protein